uniref:Uncharacterized protein n=1 Tax=Aureoumbra lagunensis TaxID=44058 RepID=A0A7S3JRF0_9STRA|mmetsp:Transcript_20236/g.30863  ORF Transcript_20236/g.30863 Transcript_20236/m.30863 type:complete len:543 (+) Transcript_20236:51-1679(+)
MEDKDKEETKEQNYTEAEIPQLLSRHILHSSQQQQDSSLRPNQQAEEKNQQEDSLSQEDNQSAEKKIHQRRGKWTAEEEVYAEQLIIDFQAGTVPNCEEGVTLRAFLAKELSCDRMRISKKYAGASIGKLIFRRRAPPEHMRLAQLNQMKQAFFRSALAKRRGGMHFLAGAQSLAPNRQTGGANSNLVPIMNNVQHVPVQAQMQQAESITQQAQQQMEQAQQQQRILQAQIEPYVPNCGHQRYDYMGMARPPIATSWSNHNKEAQNPGQFIESYSPQILYQQPANEKRQIRETEARREIKRHCTNTNNNQPSPLKEQQQEKKVPPRHPETRETDDSTSASTCGHQWHKKNPSPPMYVGEDATRRPPTKQSFHHGISSLKRSWKYATNANNDDDKIENSILEQQNTKKQTQNVVQVTSSSSDEGGNSSDLSQRMSVRQASQSTSQDTRHLNDTAGARNIGRRSSSAINKSKHNGGGNSEDSNDSADSASDGGIKATSIRQPSSSQGDICRGFRESNFDMVLNSNEFDDDQVFQDSLTYLLCDQ